MKVSADATGPAHAPAMTRTLHPSKAAWASAKAAELRAAASALPVVAGSDWRAVKQRDATRRQLLAEAARFEAIAARFAARAA